MRIAILLLVTFALRAGADDAAGAEFFEKRIRPVFAEHCYTCHSAASKSVKGGLRLDTRDGIAKGGASGKLLVPGKPAESLLLKALRHEEPVESMPPDGKLPARQIADVEEWIRLGATVPESAAKAGTDLAAAAKTHWAFQPIPAWSPADSIDSIIQRKLAAAGLKPSPAADKRTLLRRVYIDLIGLPPTWDEVQAFEADPAPDAYAKAVDRLLASPRYGERWGRHWLDVARYADTKDGVLQYGEDRLRPFAYTYRDYVIRAWNEDIPFDRFVRDQLAADQMKLEPWRLAALGFLTLGRQFDNNIHDVIDDRIDVVTRGLLGLTVSCARCHDHKFDPVPTVDYYSLYGVFSACEVPLVLPLLDPGVKGPADYEKKYAETIAGIRKMHDQQYSLLLDAYRSRVEDYLLRVATTKTDPVETAVFFFSFAPDELRPPLVNRWRQYLAKHAKPGHPIFGPWAELLAMPEDQVLSRAPEILKKSSVNPLVLKSLLAQPLKSRSDVAKAYGSLLKSLYFRAKALPPAPMNASERELLALFEEPDGPGYFPKNQAQKLMSRAEADAFGGMIQKLDKLAVKEPAAPARAMALADLSDSRDPQVFIRGNPSLRGDTVPRQFISTLSAQDRKPFANGSGRLELADAILDERNPLTARVIVNRVWMHHFGEPLVDTPSDFGLRTARPLQHELLDYMAATLKADGWSLKKLHRRIVLSNTYRQSSRDLSVQRDKDPENRYFWRANRRRLDFETMRDSLLAASGRIDFTMYGRATDIANNPTNRRRSVYGLVDRQSLPGVFRSFDFANPDQSIERRPVTTVPQQALFALNSPFIIEQAKSLADRPEVASPLDPSAKVRAIYRLALGREPGPSEMTPALAFVHGVKTPAKLEPWAQLAQVILITNEFLFVD